MNAIDSKTKFILSEFFVEKKDIPSVKIFLSKIKRICWKQILERYDSEKHKPENERKLITFVCDGCETYRTVFNILFRRVAKLVFGIPIKYRKFGVLHNNNAIERYNKEIKRRLVVFGSFRSLEGARMFLSMKSIIYNFINPHSELNGRTPAQAAGIKIELGENRLLNLIKFAARQR